MHSTRARLQSRLKEKTNPARDLSAKLLPIIQKCYAKFSNDVAKATTIDQCLVDNLVSVNEKFKVRFSKELFDKVPSEIDLELQATVDFIQQVRELLNQYQYNNEKEKILIECKAYDVLIDCMDFFYKCVTQVFFSVCLLGESEVELKKAKHTWVKDITNNIIDIITILQNHSTTVSGQNIQDKPPVLNFNMGLLYCDVLIHQAAGENDIPNLNRYLILQKHMHKQVSYKNSVKNNSRTMRNYYVFKSKLALLLREVDDARKFLLKSRTEVEKLAHEKEIIVTQHIELCMSLAEEFNKKGDLQNSLLCYQITRDFLLIDRELIDNKGKEPDKDDDEKKDFVDFKNFVETNDFITKQKIKTLKQEIRNNKRRDLFDAANKILNCDKIEWQDTKQASIKISHLKFSKFLIQFLCEAKIYYDIVDNVLTFNDVLNLSIDVVAAIFENYQNKVREIAKFDSVPVLKEEAPKVIPAAVMLPPVPELKLKPKAKKKKHAKIKIVEKMPSKIIKWDDKYTYTKGVADCHIYKLFSPFSRGNYVYVAPELAEEVYNTNRIAYNDLISTCKVGHVLGNSKGKKGVILKNAPFEGRKPSIDKSDVPQAYIKLKNCKKDWRFYGHAEKIVDANGKRYTLFRIDSWAPSHKNRIKPAKALMKKSI